MKKVFILFSVLVGITFTSCSSDDDSQSDDTQTQEAALIGLWQISAQYDSSDEPYIPTGCNVENTFAFRSDGVWEFIDYNPSDTNENECVVSDFSESGLWEIDSDGQLILTYEDGYSEPVKFFSINGDELSLIFDYEGSDGENIEDKYLYKRQ